MISAGNDGLLARANFRDKMAFVRRADNGAAERHDAGGFVRGRA